MNNATANGVFPFAPNDPYATTRIAVPISSRQASSLRNHLILPEKFDPTLDVMTNLKKAARISKVSVPRIEVTRKGGKDHDPIFHARASWNNNSISATASAGTKREARANAACNLLSRLQKMIDAKAKEPLILKNGTIPTSQPNYYKPVHFNHMIYQNYQTQPSLSPPNTVNGSRSNPTLQDHQLETEPLLTLQQLPIVSTNIIHGPYAKSSVPTTAVELLRSRYNDKKESSTFQKLSNLHLAVPKQLSGSSIGSETRPIEKGKEQVQDTGRNILNSKAHKPSKFDRPIQRNSTSTSVFNTPHCIESQSSKADRLYSSNVSSRDKVKNLVETPKKLSEAEMNNAKDVNLLNPKVSNGIAKQTATEILKKTTSIEKPGEFRKFAQSILESDFAAPILGVKKAVPKQHHLEADGTKLLDKPICKESDTSGLVSKTKPSSQNNLTKQKRKRRDNLSFREPISETKKFGELPITPTQPKRPKREKLDASTSKKKPDTALKLRKSLNTETEVSPSVEAEVVPVPKKPLGQYVPRRKTRSMAARERERAAKAVDLDKNKHLPPSKRRSKLIVNDNSDGETELPTKPLKARRAKHSK